MNIRKMRADDIEPLYVLISDALVMTYIGPPYSRGQAVAIARINRKTE